MSEYIKERFTIFRLRIASLLIRAAIRIVDKNTIEGMSLVLAVEEWVKYLTSVYNNMPAKK